MTKRTIFIGDVHGCIDELNELMGKLAPTTEDRVIFLGDLINKGPDPIGVVKYVYEHKYECLRGNHELAYSHGYDAVPRYQKYYPYFVGEIHDWLVGLPFYIEGEDFIAVHAGVVPGFHPKDTDGGIVCEIRYWNTENACMGNKEHTPWYELYEGSKKIIYGHWGAKRLTIREKTIGLDSGCVYGGELSAYVLESSELVQVSAKKIYQEIK